ncbi:MAG: hypothetical protein H6968_11695 [Chromatiaceae bacterium]|nr:hypothetical protein [Chromatiaceae bacterium]
MRTIFKAGYRLAIVATSAIVGLFLAAVRFLAESALITSADNERRIHDSDLSGELNYRTGRLDAGTHPYGWYDED